MRRCAEKSAGNNRRVAAVAGAGPEVGGSVGTTPIVTHCVVKPWQRNGETADP